MAQHQGPSAVTAYADLLRKSINFINTCSSTEPDVRLQESLSSLAARQRRVEEKFNRIREAKLVFSDTQLEALSKLFESTLVCDVTSLEGSKGTMLNHRSNLLFLEDPWEQSFRFAKAAI